jgi:PAS domain S-box-containing protein
LIRYAVPLRDRIGIGAVAALLIIHSVLNYRNTRLLLENASWVAHSDQVANYIGDVRATALAIQNSARAFAASGEDSLLDDYRWGKAKLPGMLRALEVLTRDNTAQQLRIAKLKFALHDWMNFQTERVRAGHGASVSARARAVSVGARRMDAVEEELTAITDAERRLLRQRDQRMQRTYRLSLVTGMAAGVISLLMLALFLRNLVHGQRERARAVASAFEQEQWFRTTLNSIGDAVMATDPEGRVTYVNRVAEHLSGWSQQEAQGRPVETVFRIVNEDSRKTVDDPVAKVRASGHIVGLANHTVLLAKNGAEYPIDDSAAPIRDKDGKMSGVVLVFHDVTEQRKVSRALQRSEARKSAIVSNALDGIITIDHRGHVLEFNPAAEEIFGYRAEEVLGREMAQFIVPEHHRGSHRLGIERYLRTGDGPFLNKRTELTGLHADGREFPLELAITSIEGEGMPLFTGHLRDITERKHTENELRETAARLSESDRRKSEFIAILAHELRNPLAPVRNALELIEVSGRDPATLDIALPMMQRQLGQLIRLIDDLLDITRISHGKVALQPSVVDLVEIVKEAEEAVRMPCQQAGQDLQVVLPQGPLRTYADGVRLLQVFSNLLNNACKFTQRGGSIIISLERQGHEAVVRVKDTGIGIAAGEISRIFTLFAQVEDPLGRRKQEGLGVGLSLVSLLVDMHQGSVTARSEGKDKGSEFEVRLPLVEVRDDPDANTDVHQLRDRARRVLVVDDNRDAAESLGHLLRKRGHEVFEAYDGVQGVQEAARHLPEVVVLDLGMPGLNGYEVAERLRRMPGMEQSFLIALTGWGQEEDRQRSKAAGFDAHLTKPADNVKLVDLLRAVRRTDEA